MLLITIVLIIIGIIAYAIIGNIIIHFLDDYHWIDIEKDTLDVFGEDVTYFILGIFFPIVLFYILVREVSIYIYTKFSNYE